MSADVDVRLFDMKAFQEKVLPAYRAFLDANDARLLIGLLQECIEMREANPQLSDRLFWDRESFDEDIGILNATVYYSPNEGRSSNQGQSEMAMMVKKAYARDSVSGKILEVLCVPYNKGVNPVQDMTNSQLVPYLYKKSEWITDLFTFARQVRGNQLEFAIGDSSEAFTKQDIQEFDVELDKAGPPEDTRLQPEYDNLRALVKRALAEPDLTLILSVG